MKKIIITALLTIQLFAQNTTTSKNPTVYSALGDIIYNNVNNIEKLQSIAEYEKSKLQKYVKDVQKAKKIGSKIQFGDNSINKGAYLKSLRELSVINDYYIHSIRNNFKEAIKAEDNNLFLITINTGLISITKNKEIIKKYYYKHQDDINATGTIIQDLIDEKNKKPIYKGLTDAQLEKREIERIRKKDRIRQEKIERSLEEEVIRKKAKIRKDQKEELGVKTN